MKPSTIAKVNWAIWPLDGAALPDQSYGTVLSSGLFRRSGAPKRLITQTLLRILTGLGWVHYLEAICQHADKGGLLRDEHVGNPVRLIIPSRSGEIKHWEQNTLSSCESRG